MLCKLCQCDKCRSQRNHHEKLVKVNILKDALLLEAAGFVEDRAASHEEWDLVNRLRATAKGFAHV